jgi:hypothetical protein
MNFDSFNLIGKYKSVNEVGISITYNKGDMVSINGEYYICKNSNTSSNPMLGESSGWVKFSETQVFFSSKTEPFISKEGDEWLNLNSGVRYKRVIDNNGNHWVEL